MLLGHKQKAGSAGYENKPSNSKRDQVNNKHVYLSIQLQQNKAPCGSWTLQWFHVFSVIWLYVIYIYYKWWFRETSVVPCLFLSHVYIPCDIYITYNIYYYKWRCRECVWFHIFSVIWLHMTYIWTYTSIYIYITDDDVENQVWLHMTYIRVQEGLSMVSQTTMCVVRTKNESSSISRFYRHFNPNFLRHVFISRHGKALMGENLD